METDSVAVYGEDDVEFKSYYVVWKPFFVMYVGFIVISLNRTM